MRRLLIFLGAGALLMGTALPAVAQGQRDDNGVCFYRDVQYRGESWCYRAGDELADLRNRGNQISSVRVFGRARVEVFDQRDFRGASDEFDHDIPYPETQNYVKRILGTAEDYRRLYGAAASGN